MSSLQKNESTVKNSSPKKIFLESIVLILLSLIPGAVISIMLLFNSLVHDITVQHARNTLTSADLSGVRIEGYMLGQYVTAWSPKENSSIIYCENKESFSNDTTNTKSDSPIESISMIYPIIKSQSCMDDDDKETWKMFTIHGKPMPKFEEVVDALGNSYMTVVNWRDESRYNVYIDYKNDLELRFYYSGREINKVLIRRIDNSRLTEFLAIYRQDFFKIDFNMRGNSIIRNCYIKTVIADIGRCVGSKQFLLNINEYFSLLPYFAAWTLPLIWALYKRRCAYFVAIFIWYPAWYFYGVITYIAYLY